MDSYGFFVLPSLISMLSVERLSLLRFLADMSNLARIAHREDFSRLTSAH